MIFLRLVNKFLHFYGPESYNFDQNIALFNYSEVCHPRCVFKLEEGVNFRQKHNYNMAKMMVFMAEQNKKLHVSAYIGHHQFFTTSR